MAGFVTSPGIGNPNQDFFIDYGVYKGDTGQVLT